jgi:uncharacterized protein (TIGR02246 family)
MNGDSVAQDEQAITRLMHVYNWSTDAQDYERLAACFTADGTFIGVYGTWVMRAQLDGFAAAARARARVTPSRHFISAPVIEVDGDTATAVTALLVTRQSADGPSIGLTGEYHDDLVRVEGRWLFSRRRVVVDRTGSTA